MTSMRRLVVACLFVCCSAIFPTWAKGTCAAQEGSKPQAQLAYLKGDRQTLTVDCILYALEQLGVERYTPSIETLVQYLDFQRPQKPPVGEVVVALHKPWVGSEYPAGSALLEIGEPAVPALVKAIAESESDLIRKNAAEVIYAIHAGDTPQAVALLNRAAKSKSSTDWGASLRLYDAAKGLAAKCLPETRNACMKALFEDRP